ncbi:GntR family transcriptional regulator [Paenibacillus sp. P25]|nr:GntR family transcriptional regulator [Paenibacillus sp. P25]
MMKNVTLDIVLAEKIRDHITRNRLTEGDRIPSDRELAVQYGVQRLTVRSALKRLENEGIIYPPPRSGFYVAEKKLVRDLIRFESLTEMMNNQGLRMVTRLIRLDAAECSKKLSRHLEVPLGTKLAVIRRMRIVEGKPFALETSYLRADAVPGIERYDLENQSLYKVLKESYGIDLCGASQEISMVFARDEESRLLEAGPGEALLMLKSETVDRDGRRVEYSESLTRGDRCIFTNILTRREPSS